MTAAPKFKNYTEAQAWIKAGQNNFGKRAFTARPEYHAAYAQLSELYKTEFPTRKRANRKTATRIGQNVNLLSFAINQ